MGIFQSTPPSREATGLLIGVIDLLVISIHASLTGGDPVAGVTANFNVISIHASLTGGD